MCFKRDVFALHHCTTSANQKVRCCIIKVAGSMLISIPFTKQRGAYNKTPSLARATANEGAAECVCARYEEAPMFIQP